MQTSHEKSTGDIWCENSRIVRKIRYRMNTSEELTCGLGDHNEGSRRRIDINNVKGN